MNFERKISQLKGKLEDGPERVGFILKSGKIVEVTNVCVDTNEGFEVSGADLIKYQTAVASWHTHPGKPSTLSAEDHHGFRNYPQWTHFIIGTDGVTSYRVEKGRVLIDKQWINEG